jgi:Flp pilus assembly protein TadD
LFCAHCGAETQTGETRCTACGRPLPVQAGQASDAARVAPRPPAAPLSPNDVLTIAPSSSATHLEPGLSGTTLVPGQAFGTRYRIIRELGRGGMGVVYQAWDDELGIAVALKTIRPETVEDPEAAREHELRFKRELVLARQVTHKHVVRIHDLGEINGIKYLTMPFIQGETLAARIRREGHLPVARALRFAKQIVSGLVAAHDEGVVHRDLKPANIMIDGEDEIVILDFGLARSVSGMTVGTATGTLMGTVEYMAPEQASGSRVDQRADIYTFGLILHEMLVGRRRSSDTALGELMLRTREAPASVRSIDPQIPEAIDRIVARCLKPNPAERCQTSAELAADLEQLDAEGQPLLERAALRPRRAWLVPALAVLCLAAVAAAVSLFIWGGRAGQVPVAHTPVSVLIADFDNQAGEKVFEGAVEQALSIAIEGASFITSYPRTDAARVLDRIKPGETLTEANARLVAQREGIHVVLPGVIARQDSEYRIRLKVIDPSGQAKAQAVEVTARTKSDVLSAVASLAGKVRTGLGDTASVSAMRAAGETFTTASLEAMREYAAGQDLLLRRRDSEAIDHFRAAIQHDPHFGRAYAGWAVAAFTLGRQDEAYEQWKRAMQFIDRMTDREKYRTLGSYYLGVSRDFDKAVENYEALVRRYPADTSGLNNLALACFNKLDFAKALEVGQRAIDLQKNSVRFRSNYALYAMYAGRFDEAEDRAKKLIADARSSYIVYLPLAVAQAAKGNLEAARETYMTMAATGESGQSAAALGLADLLIYQGATAEARRVLERAIAEDQRAGRTVDVIAKYAALADASLIEGDKRGAVAAADALVKLGRQEEALVPAAAFYLAFGREVDAQRLAADLWNQVPSRTRAYGKMIEGQLALRQGRHADAIEAFNEGLKHADLWLLHYNLGVAKAGNGDFPGAYGELANACEKNKGEATAVFLNDRPTLRYLAPLRYWQARVTEGLKGKPAAAEDYKKFLALRPEGSKDPLAIDARKRLAQ